MFVLLPCLARADAFDDYITERFKVRKVVGGAVIIARDGKILYSADYGHKNAGKTDPVTLDTCFRVASVTKLVTAVGLLQLLEYEQINLDTPVKDVVGFPVINPAFPNEPITIRQVLSHTSGLMQTQHYFPNWGSLPLENDYFPPQPLPARPICTPILTAASWVR